MLSKAYSTARLITLFLSMRKSRKGTFKGPYVFIVEGTVLDVKIICIVSFISVLLSNCIHKLHVTSIALVAPVHSSKVSSVYLRPAQSIAVRFNDQWALSRPAKAHSCRSPSPQLSTPLVALSLAVQLSTLVAEEGVTVTESD